MKYKAIIFDLEGVVADTQHIWDEEGRRLLSSRALALPAPWADFQARLAGQSLLEGAQYIKEYFGLPVDAAVLADERLVTVRELFVADISFVPGFRELWDALPGASYRTGVATALHPTLFAVVKDRLQLETYFGQHLYSIADVGWKSKPDPAVFLYAAEKLGVLPEQCVVIEDAPNGIVAARRAGMKTVGFSRTLGREHVSDADMVVDDLKDAALFIQKGI